MPRGVYQRRPRGAAVKPAAVKTVPLAEAIADATGLDPAQMDLGDLADVQVAGVVISHSDTLDEPEQPRRFLSGAPIAAAKVETAPEPAPSEQLNSCAMVERLWRKQYPVWQCATCRVDTFDPAQARCPKGLPK